MIEQLKSFFYIVSLQSYEKKHLNSQTHESSTIVITGQNALRMVWLKLLWKHSHKKLADTLKAMALQKG